MNKMCLWNLPIPRPCELPTSSEAPLWSHIPLTQKSYEMSYIMTCLTSRRLWPAHHLWIITTIVRYDDVIFVDRRALVIRFRPSSSLQLSSYSRPGGVSVKKKKKTTTDSGAGRGDYVLVIGPLRTNRWKPRSLCISNPWPRREWQNSCDHFPPFLIILWNRWRTADSRVEIYQILFFIVVRESTRRYELCL